MALRRPGTDCEEKTDLFAALAFDKNMNQNNALQEANGCVLSRLSLTVAKRTALFAFIAASQNTILTKEWLLHYKTLGVQLHRSKVVVDTGGASSTAVDATTHILRSRDVQVELISEYTSELKRMTVNKFIRTLPPDSLLVYPDSDELFD